jgi:hypothetical protein
MPVKVNLEGLGSLREALMKMPVEMRAAAGQLVERAANNTAERLLAVYPQRNGALQQGVYVVDKSTQWTAKWRVESRSKEAEWWEFGTQNRHTQEGWNRGSTPAHKGTGLISIAKDVRRGLVTDLIEFVTEQGFAVTEDLS